MKALKWVLALILGALCFPLPHLTAYAASAPHVVVEGEIWLLSEDGTRLFLLPESYYVRIVNLDDAFYYVTFNEVNGKIDRQGVRTTGYHTAASGTRREMSLNPDYADMTGVYLKSAPALSAENASEIHQGERCTFLGHYPTEDGVWYYVEYAGEYGYLRADRTDYDLSIPTFVPEAEPADTPTDDSPAATDEGENDTLLKVLIIVGVSVPAVLIVFLLFRSGKGKKEKYE